MYEAFYGFSAKPFQLSPDARFFFNSTVHNRAMAYLRYGLRQGEGFIVVTGGVGTGKTMLVRNLFAELDRQSIVAAQLVSTQVGADDVLRLVNAAFGLPHENLSKAALLRNLEAFFRARRAEGKRVLLVIDEAQNLSPEAVEELRMLSNYQEGGEALLQSFLLGQVELKRTLQGRGMEQVRQRIIAGYHLRPLGQDELQPYIEHRLTQVGWEGNPTITPGAYEEVYSATGGVPRRVNTLFERLLLYGCLSEKRSLDRKDVEVVLREVAQEVGHGGADDPGDAKAVSSRSAPGLAGGDLAGRVAKLERELEGLRAELHRDRQLLKRTILMQMEAVDDDDVA
jgi:putative secretion ATPase (PEP-CTERM system associated)